MASHLKDWLGPLVERELQVALASRCSPEHGSPTRTIGTAGKGGQVQALGSLVEHEGPFNEDCSTLTVGSRVPTERARAVQLLHVISDKPLKWLVSDGYTTITAKVPRSTQETFRVDAARDAVELKRLTLLSISDMDIRATVHGKTDERIQIQLNQIHLLSSSRNGPPGNLQGIHERDKVVQLQERLRRVFQVRRSELDGRDGGNHRRTQAASKVLDDGGIVTPERVPEGRSQDSQNSSALNLAPPVVVPRGDARQSSFGAKVSDLYHSTVRPAARPPDAGRSLREVADISGGSNWDVREDRVWKGAWPEENHTPHGSPVIESRRASQPPDSNLGHAPDEVDASSELVAVRGAGIEQWSRDAPSLVEERLRRRSSPQTSEVPSAVAGPNRTKQESEAHTSAAAAIDAPIPLNQCSPLMAEPSVQGRTRSSSKPATNTSPIVSWLPHARVLRAPCIVDEEQLQLLNREISWNPPVPPNVFPSPNIPRVLLEQLEKALVEADAQGSDRASDAAPSSVLRSSSSDVSEDSALSGWHPSPAGPPRLYHGRIDLPPDSSHDAVQVQSNKAHKFSPEDNPTAHDEDVELSSLSLGNARKTVDKAQEQPHEPSQSPKMVRSSPEPPATFPSVTQSSMRRSGIKSKQPIESYDMNQPSTLPDSAFRSQYPPHSDGQTPVNAERLVTSTYTPDFQSGQPTARRLFPNVKQGASITASESDATMAEQRLQRNRQASAQTPSSHRNPLLSRQQALSYAEPLNSVEPKVELAQQVYERGIDRPTTPPKVLGKHPPSTALSPEGRSHHKSRFGFSQEDPLSQDPAVLAKSERKNFMRQRAAQNQYRRAHEQPVDSSPPPLPATTVVAPNTPLAKNGSKQAPVHVIISSPPRPVPVPRNVVSPQAIAATQTYTSKADKDATEIATSHEHNASGVSTMQVSERFTPRSVFQEMKDAYPVYNEDKNFVHFSNLTSRLNAIKRVTHRFLWDDFVVRYKTDWLPYSHQCLEDGIETMKYEQYYMERIASPLYTAGVLDENKMDALFSKQDRVVDHHDSNVASDQSRRSVSKRREENTPGRYRDEENNMHHSLQAIDNLSASTPRPPIGKRGSVVVARLDGSNRRRQQSGSRAQNPFFTRQGHDEDNIPMSLSDPRRSSSNLLPTSSNQNPGTPIGAGNISVGRPPSAPRGFSDTNEAEGHFQRQRSASSYQSYRPIAPPHSSSRPGSGPSPKRPRGGRWGGIRRF